MPEAAEKGASALDVNCERTPYPIVGPGVRRAVVYERRQFALVEPFTCDPGFESETTILAVKSEWSSGILNAIGCTALTLTATPSFMLGVNFHCRTATSVALLRARSVELTTTGLSTSPLAEIVKPTTTSPSTPDSRSWSEYAGATCRIGLAFCAAADSGANADTVSAAAMEQEDKEGIFMMGTCFERFG